MSSKKTSQLLSRPFVVCMCLYRCLNIRTRSHCVQLCLKDMPRDVSLSLRVRVSPCACLSGQVYVDLYGCSRLSSAPLSLFRCVFEVYIPSVSLGRFSPRPLCSLALSPSVSARTSLALSVSLSPSSSLHLTTLNFSSSRFSSLPRILAIIRPVVPAVAGSVYLCLGPPLLHLLRLGVYLLSPSCVLRGTCC